ncbi:Retrovirus-related Pol polyprotein like [Argiope bruennichi]|uniref:Retrovirus-related Pol polyprotein like n=1 Tax=Argiope bruennichi TaxID=94029 RepID=A0A8T0EAK3_ARGBR|nr:Retrovirus-related Pol polyprotein like [Argiope bruennichi]
MKSNESANDYVPRARGIATKCHSLGLDVPPRELVYYTERGMTGKFSKVREILKTQRDKSMDEILEISHEEENTCYSQTSTRAEGIDAVVFYSRKNKSSGERLCYICRSPNHIARTVFTGIKILVEVLHQEESLSDKIWLLDSGASCHMAKGSMWFEEIIPETRDIYLAGKDSKILCEGVGTVKIKTADLCGPIQPESFGGAKYFMILVDDFSGMYFTCFLKNKNEVFNTFSQFKAKYENLTDKRIKKLRIDNGLEFVNELDTYLANSGIFHEKTIPYNSESNGKAEERTTFF